MPDCNFHVTVACQLSFLIPSDNSLKSDLQGHRIFLAKLRYKGEGTWVKTVPASSPLSAAH